VALPFFLHSQKLFLSEIAFSGFSLGNHKKFTLPTNSD